MSININKNFLFLFILLFFLTACSSESSLEHEGIRGVTDEQPLTEASQSSFSLTECYSTCEKTFTSDQDKLLNSESCKATCHSTHAKSTNKVEDCDPIADTFKDPLLYSFCIKDLAQQASNEELCEQTLRKYPSSPYLSISCYEDINLNLYSGKKLEICEKIEKMTTSMPQGSNEFTLAQGAVDQCFLNIGICDKLKSSYARKGCECDKITDSSKRTLCHKKKNGLA
ncbi:MAG: hypothetical protein WC595_01830 [Candidatus Nanoarchaeia archaeon]